MGDIGNDKLFGAAGLDLFYGGTGDDHPQGGRGKAIIDGGEGKDQVRAGGGNDRIDTGYFERLGFRIGDGVVDTVDCGFGTDTVYYEKGRNKLSSDCENKIPY